MSFKVSTMTINCIGCGSSAKHWDGSGYSIGVNDVYKLGHPVTELIIVNHPRKFKERLNTILDGGKANAYGQVFSHKPGDWKELNAVQLPLSPFSNRVRKGVVYKSGGTSPFIAISKAFYNGATEIVIWGVDFQNHPVFKPGSNALKNELFQYKKLIEGIGNHGVQVYLGAAGSALEAFVEIKK